MNFNLHKDIALFAFIYAGLGTVVGLLSIGLVNANPQDFELLGGIAKMCLYGFVCIGAGVGVSFLGAYQRDLGVNANKALMGNATAGSGLVILILSSLVTRVFGLELVAGVQYLYTALILIGGVILVWVFIDDWIYSTQTVRILLGLLFLTGVGFILLGFGFQPVIAGNLLQFPYPESALDKISSFVTGICVILSVSLIYFDRRFWRIEEE